MKNFVKFSASTKNQFWNKVRTELNFLSVKIGQTNFKPASVSTYNVAPFSTAKKKNIAYLKENCLSIR